ncbi:MAG: glycosyltransferase family 4 protein [Verrucomicrobia bacterium]|nr:glycosyltransferase family 4 protein [Verrucomicrobiota bacterium]
MKNTLKVAFLTTDNREQMGSHELPEPFFGTAMTALLQGLALFPDLVELHVISCSKRAMVKPEKLGPNCYFHQPVVPRIGWGRTAFAGCGLAVRRVLKKIRPDVVHAQGTERDCAVSMMLAPKGPRLLTIHGHMARIAEITGAGFPSYYWLASGLERLAVRKATGVVALNHYTENRVAADAKKAWVVPNAVDEAFFRVVRNPEPGLALCVANVHPWKRQVELMESLSASPVIERPQRLVFLGEGSECNYGRRFSAAVERNRTWCEHKGKVGRQELSKWLARAQLLILPSIEDNCPMAVLEAMAAGVPVLGSRVGGVPELIEEGRTGATFDPLDAAGIRELIREALAASDKLENWGHAGRNAAMERYHPAVVARRHVQIYHEVAGR